MPKHNNHHHHDNNDHHDDDEDGNKGGRDGDDGGEREFEHDEGNAAHIEIEERRFRGGLPPTPERYARARGQWNRLPGSVPRFPPGPVGQPPDDANEPPAAEPAADDDHGNHKEGS
jgi:hypothetical protein